MAVLARKWRSLSPESRRRIYEYGSLGIAAVVATIWIIRIILQPARSPYYMALVSVEFFTLEIFLACFVILHILNWREKMNRLSREILQVVMFRRKTPLRALASKFKISIDLTTNILTRLTRGGEIKGEIKQDIFHLLERKTPKCHLCGQEIEPIDRLMVCPFCRMPFHKDHLIEYVNDVAEWCPACKSRLTIADIFSPK